jgi:2-polyprenyl-3-methyl-5-hydroxy-6-metoxy-1,4-benzoquinol methylase
MIMTRPMRFVGAAAPEQNVSVQLESVDCPLCAGQDYKTVVVSGDHLTRIGGNFRVVQCRCCQLAFTNPRPTERSIGLFYPESYGPYSGHEPGMRVGRSLRRRLEHAVLRRRFGYPSQPTGPVTAVMGALGNAMIRTTRQRESWIPFRQPGRMLDFGCGAGGFMKRMREHGWNVEGIDVSHEVAHQLRESAGFQVHVGTLPHPDIRPESFDAIAMWHSLEHVHSPRGVLQAARDALRTNGLLVVGVPNFASWTRQHFQHNWFGLELPRHLTHFTPATLSTMAEAEGFRVLSIVQVGHSSSVRKSAHRAAQSGSGSWWQRSLQWNRLSRPVAQWAQRIGQADAFRMIAEKV